MGLCGTKSTSGHSDYEYAATPRGSKAKAAEAAPAGTQERRGSGAGRSPSADSFETMDTWKRGVSEESKGSKVSKETKDSKVSKASRPSKGSKETTAREGKSPRSPRSPMPPKSPQGSAAQPRKTPPLLMVPPPRSSSKLLSPTASQGAAPRSPLASPGTPDVERSRSMLSAGLTAIARESSIWRARVIMDNRGNIGEHYDLDRHKLGEGSYGYVCKGRSRATGSVLAVKHLSKDQARTLRVRYRQEIAIMKLIDHPNIVKLVETFEDKAHIFLVMELCAGGDLWHRLEAEGYFSEARTAAIMQQILRPVCYMHEKRICHRDIKPENFLFVSGGPVEQSTLKMVDFGFSCLVKQDGFLTTRLGTPRYSAPQVLAGRYDLSCDLWSCGVIMYVLLCSQPPFQGKTDAEVMQSVRRGNYAFRNLVWKGVSEDAKDLIRSLLKYQEQDRASAEQALAHHWLKARAPRAAVEAPVEPSLILDLRNFCLQNKLRQAALHIVAQQLTEEETKTFRHTFAALDVRGTGVLSIAELGESFRGSKGLPGLTEELQEVLDELSTGDEGAEISYTDFLAATLDTRHCLKEGTCRAAFRAFDRNGDGRISREELEALLKCDGEAVEGSRELISELLHEVDVNKDGVIDFQEFRTMLAGTTAP